MEQRDINFLKMTSGVISGMDSEKTVWDKEIEIENLFSDIKTIYGGIESTHQEILGISTSGLTGQKNNLFASIIMSTFKLCNKMSAYAKLRKDFALLPLVDISISTLRHGVEKEATERCAAIVKKAMTMLAQTTTFKVTEPELTGILQKIAAYNNSLDSRTTTTGNRTVSADEIDEGIASLREMLDILDNLVIGLIDDEGFVARYLSWRRIIDYGIDKTLPKKEKPEAKIS